MGTSPIAGTVTTAVPILLLIALGVILRVARVLTDGGVAQIKALIVNAALPAVLFGAFLTLEFDSRYFGLFAFIGVLLLALLAVGYALGRLPRWRAPVPFLMTGFEFGMLGIGLFGTAYGAARIGVISVIGLPHELFIWFIYVTLMRLRFGGRQSIAATAKGFATSPIILAIAAGLILNLSGVGAALLDTLGGQAAMAAVDLLGGVVGPLILLVVGHGMRLTAAGARAALPVVAVRYAVVGVLAVTVVPLVVEGALGLRPIFTHAMVTFILLPPPYIVPLYIPESRRDDQAYANNVLTLSTILTIVLFLGYVALTA